METGTKEGHQILMEARETLLKVFTVDKKRGDGSKSPLLMISEVTHSMLLQYLLRYNQVILNTEINSASFEIYVTQLMKVVFCLQTQDKIIHDVRPASVFAPVSGKSCCFPRSLPKLS